METIALLHFVSFLSSLHPFLPIFRPILIFFNGQTGNQNSVLVNFAQEPETGVKDGFEEMEHEFL